MTGGAGSNRKGRLPPRLHALRRVASRLTSPLLPDDYLSLINPLWSARELRGKVVKVVPETDSAATLVIRPGWGWNFDYQPGQYVGIGVNVSGRWQWRSYSLTSPPKRDQGHISVTVKAMPEGLLSSHLVRGVAPGTVVRLALPQGDFVLPEPPPAKLLFLTGGSGLTPVMAMLRTLSRRGTLGDVVLVHAAPKQTDVLFRAELHELAAAHPGFVLHEHHSDAAGQLILDDLDQLVPDWSQRQAWACGPAPMLADAERVFASRGRAGSLHLERFSAARSGGGQGGTVTFEHTDGGRLESRSAVADGATSILEAAEAVGVGLPFGCRMGICRSCVLPLTAGVARDLRTGDLVYQNENVQTCMSAPDGDCTITY